MIALFTSLLALLAGPLLSRLLEKQQVVTSFLDGVIRIIVGGVVLLHILPQGVTETGAWAPLFVLAGALLVFIVEALPDQPRLRRNGTFLLAAIGLACHSFLDGIVLGDPDEHDHAAELLTYAIVLHTLPVGMLVWQSLKPSIGSTLTWLVLLAGAGATLAGFVSGQHVLPETAHSALILLQCTIGGTLVHVLAHAQVDRNAEGRAASGIGALIGGLAVLWLLDTHPLPQPFPQQLASGPALLALAFPLSPALLLGYVARGAWFALLPPRNPSGAAAGLSLALRQPEASCGAGPWHRRVLETRPTSTVLAFLVASPQLGAPTVFASAAMLGVGFSGVRLAATVVLSALLGLSKDSHPPAPPPAHPQNPWRFALVDGVDHTAPWVLAGLLLAAALEPLLSPTALAGPTGVDVVTVVFLGLPAYICSIGLAPVVLILLHKGLSFGAAAALSVAAPATNLATLKQLGERHGWRAAGMYTAVVTGGAIALGIGLNASGLFSTADLPTLSRVPPNFVESFSLVALAVLFIASLLRQGAGGFIAQILHPYGNDAEHHEHEHAEHTH